MKLWTLHPCHLDKAGLTGMWREALIAKNCLENPSNRYYNHPQLNRFKEQNNPISYITRFLKVIYREAEYRNYKFNWNLVNENILCPIPFIKPIKISKKQIEYEVELLKHKLTKRIFEKGYGVPSVSLWSQTIINPIFIIDFDNNEIESWERPIESILRKVG